MDNTQEQIIEEKIEKVDNSTAFQTVTTTTTDSNDTLTTEDDVITTVTVKKPIDYSIIDEQIADLQQQKTNLQAKTDEEVAFEEAQQSRLIDKTRLAIADFDKQISDLQAKRAKLSELGITEN